jgi:hypothetical protein
VERPGYFQIVTVPMAGKVGYLTLDFFQRRLAANRQRQNLTLITLMNRI